MSDLDGHRAERQAWIALAATPGVGDVTFARLVEAYGSALGVLDAVSGLPMGSADGRLAGRLGRRVPSGLSARIRAAAGDPEDTAAMMQALGGWILTPLDAAYPGRLHELEQPPRVLFGLGRADLLTGTHLVAVVGTRRPTPTGRDLAGRVAARLAAAGVTVVSGLALGIDGAAHRASLDAGGLTVAVVGSGLDEPGPAAHRRLARDIAASGAIVSELAPGTSATRGTFPMRNRIISALASGTIVVEAPARSGALITARHALEQGRRLLVAPGRPLDPRVAGCLALLRETPARPLVGLDEMIVDLGLDADSTATPDRPGPLSATAALALLGPSEREVASALLTGPQTVDGLVRLSGLDPGVVAGVLTLLQLRGWVHAHGAVQLAAGPLLSGDRHEAA